jgi:hypothetical protein
MLFTSQELEFKSNFRFTSRENKIKEEYGAKKLCALNTSECEFNSLSRTFCPTSNETS